jgi:hypothetical protein
VNEAGFRAFLNVMGCAAHTPNQALITINSRKFKFGANIKHIITVIRGRPRSGAKEEWHERREK